MRLSCRRFIKIYGNNKNSKVFSLYSFFCSVLRVCVYIYIYIYIYLFQAYNHVFVKSAELNMWHYGWHPFLCVWVPVREFLCLLWCETHTKGLGTRSLARPEVDEGRKISEKTERVSWQRRPEEDGQQKGPVDRTGQSGRWKQCREERRTEVRKTTVKTYWPTEAGLANARKWVGILSGFVEVSRKYMSTIAWKCTENYSKVSQTLPLLHLELTQARVCLFILFFHALGCVLCVHKEMCKGPS